MESLSAYASDEEAYSNTKDTPAVQAAKHHPSRREDDTNYDHVTMDMSEESTNNNSDYDSSHESNRRSSQSSGDRERHNVGSSPKERRSKDVGERGYSRHESKRSSERRNEPSSSSSKSYDERSSNRNRSKKNDQPSPTNDDKKLNEKAVDSSKREHSDRRDESDKKEKDLSDQREKEDNRDRRYNSHKDKYDKKSHVDRKRHRSRSRDKNGHRRRTPSSERDKPKRAYDRHSESSKSFNTRDGRRFRKSRSKSPTGSGEYKPSYKVSKKLQAMDKMGLQIKTPDGSMATAQMLMKRSMAEQAEKAKNATGVELPKYYNPAAVNPLRYADQIQKRKLLWGSKSKEGESRAAETATPVAGASSAPASKWLETKFAQDSDGKVASKFMRLMGIKNTEVPARAAETPGDGDQAKKREEMFEAMQAQYEVARATTHSLRGVGLGFSARSKPF